MIFVVSKLPINAVCICFLAVTDMRVEHNRNTHFRTLAGGTFIATRSQARFEVQEALS